MPWFEQFNKHELISEFDWSIFSNCCIFSCDTFNKFPNDGLSVKWIALNEVVDAFFIKSQNLKFLCFQTN